MSRRRYIGSARSIKPYPRPPEPGVRPWLLAIALASALLGGAVARAQELAAPRLGGYLQVRETYVKDTKVSGTLNRARLSADGALPNRFTFRMLVEFEASPSVRTPGSVSLREAIARWSYAPWAIQAGQFKTPFSREYLILVPNLELADFSSVVDTLAPKYDIGMMAEYVQPFGSVSLGVFNGEGQNAVNRDSTVLPVGRVTVRPLPQTTLGGHVARYSADSVRYGADVTLEQSGVLGRAEFLGQHKRGRPRNDLGWYVLGGYRVLPWLQLLAKEEDFQRPSIGRQRRISATTLGLNVELPGGKTRFLVNGVERKTGYPRIRMRSLITQVQVRL